MSHKYYNFPFIKFCLLSKDESLLEELGVDESLWKEVKEEYAEANPDPETTALVSAYKKAIKANLERNKTIAVMKYILQYEGDWKPYFEVAKLKYTGDALKDIKYLQTQIKKQETNENIFTAQLDKLRKELDEAKEKAEDKGFDIAGVYKTIASLEKAGATIPNYDELTCGKYNALTKVYTEKNGK
ncbi:hypothetical protein Phi19:1_gp095 [Cellulophaga phage phi19:1]|uniref:Uncharacterized protein n=1 Tax=Cellulophaga phage phi19:1 TaxID=1327970 RepID=R9ZXX5_9CAUD|nr:hypothetical protein Phi19:1_gp095 [Cellulophaga phage phi19:1]AGO47385.1 hypothetical protein Phi19:1_gp095 [Cellulophaga phage phi19:1]